jgi:hypothetical protein
MLLIIAVSILSQYRAKRAMAMLDRSADEDANPGDTLVETAQQSRPAAATLQAQHTRRRWMSLEASGEIVLLAMVGAFFLYMFWQSLGWPMGAWLMPRIAILIGIPFWIARLVALFRPTKAAHRQIMDTGFWLGSDPKAEAIRFLQISGWIVLLYAGIWMFGFHAALPLGIFAYLYYYGRAGWLWSPVVSAAFVALLVGVYDILLNTPWHEAVVFDFWRWMRG